MTTQLLDLETLEVSLVDTPANNRKFLLHKNYLNKEGKILSEKEKDITEKKEKEEEQKETTGKREKSTKKETKKEKEGVEKQELAEDLEELTDEEVDLLYGQIRGLWTRTGSEYLAEEVGTSIVASMVARDMAVDFDDPFVEATDFAEGDANPVEGYNEKLTKLFKEREEMRKRIDKLEKKEQLVKLVKQAQEFDSLSIEPEKFAETLYNIKKKSNEEYKEILRVLKSANEVSKNSELFDEKGSNLEGKTGTTWEQIEKMADELVTKKEITKERAIGTILKADPKLYEKYLEEQRG